MSVASHLTRAGRLSAPVKAALAKNLIHDRSPVCDLYDLDALRGRFNEVQTALPNWNHAVAIKVLGQCPMTRLNSGIFRIFELSLGNFYLNSPDCRALKII